MAAQVPPPPASPASNVPASRVAHAAPLTGSLVLDGQLDEPAWTVAIPATDFVQQQPDEGGAATLRSEVRFLYDATTLYVGATLFDELPGQLVVNELKRDFVEANNDIFGIVLDTFRDGRNAYGFLVNAGGAQRETMAYDQGERDDASWNAAWRAAHADPGGRLERRDGHPAGRAPVPRGSGPALGPEPRARDPAQERDGHLVARCRGSSRSTTWATPACSTGSRGCSPGATSA